jgi:hypothetical protein
MYEEGSPDIKKDFSKVFSFSEEQKDINLDPSLENVVDLQELLNATIPALEAEEGPLNIDSIFPASDLDRYEAGHTSAGNPVQLDIAQFVPETVRMTNSDHINQNIPGPTGSQIVTIKSEDLDLASYPVKTETDQPVYQSTQRRRTAVQPSPVEYASDSSRSSFSSDKEPIVYECRKPGRKPSAGGPIRPRKKEPAKNTPEYFEKRARNNVAVRKSREKAKLRQGETETRVQSLVDENEKLQKKVDLLTKELNVLKSLFINVGAALPENFEDILSR